jgi:beta-lactamase superfamily II metal-dependent hydrolase
LLVLFINCDPIALPEIISGVTINIIPCRSIILKKIAEEISHIGDNAISNIKQLDDSQKHCILIRGQASRTFRNVTDITQIQKCIETNLLGKEVVLIIGRPDGLEKELTDDVLLACYEANILDEQSIRSVMKSLTDGKDETVCSHTTKMNILFCPTKEELEMKLPSIISDCMATDFNIIYCGHASEDGYLNLFDESYSAKSLADLLIKNTTQHYAQTNIILNCCYAFQFMQRFLYRLNKLLLKNEEKDSSEFHNYKDKLTEYSFEYLYNGLRNFAKLHNLGDSIVDAIYEDESLTTSIQSLNNRLWEELLHNSHGFSPDRSPFQAKWSNDKVIGCWPLSIGPLSGTGALKVYYKIPHFPWIDSVEIKYRSAWYEQKEECYKRLPANKGQLDKTSPEKPILTIFKAGHGDCTLFRWHNTNILIDGGYYTNEESRPCFWDQISKLGMLDLIVLTHGDEDHIKGLLPLFKRKVFEIQDGVNHSPKIEQLLLLHIEKKGRTWQDAINLKKFADNAKINTPKNPTTGDLVYQHKYPCGDSFEIICILPDKGLSKDAMQSLREPKKEGNNKSKDGLTLINRSGIVLLFQCTIAKENKTYNLLFTGDADGENIYQTLVRKKFDKLIYSYVDMPHHGSSKNHPEEFLKINAKKIVVSTNGDHHGHPDQTTLEHLKKYLEKDKSRILYFNYNRHKPNKNSNKPKRQPHQRKIEEVKNVFGKDLQNQVILQGLGHLNVTLD